MNERDRLDELSTLTPVEILNYYRNLYYTDGNNTERGIVANAINDILPRMILPPCKVGDTVYRTIGNYCGEKIFEGVVAQISIYNDEETRFWVYGHPLGFGCDDFGKTVFLTREEAEAALKERSKDNG